LLSLVAQQLESRVAVWSTDQAKAEATLSLRAIASHAQIEDDLLYGQVRAAVGDRNPLAETTHLEHQEIHKILQALEAASPQDTRTMVRSVAAAVRGHLTREETIFFPAARHVLGEDKLRRLGVE
jgi:hypothetical protein